MAQGTKTKTYKREVAVALLVWFIYLVETKEANLIEILVWPVFTYSAIAFGLQWVSPNGGMQWPPETTYRRRPQRSSEHTDREGEFPDDREFDPERDK